MSVRKRLVNLARSNLTDFRHAFDRDRLRDLLTPKEEDPEISEESEETIGAKAGRRARVFRDAAEEAWEKAYENARARAGVRGQPISDPNSERKRWYRTLELEPGADIKDVRKAYRRLLAQYHPDRFAQDPEKLKAATEVTRKLTEAYNGLTRHLNG